MQKPNENPVGRIEQAGEKIDLKTAAAWTRNYRQANPGETISQLFGKEIFEKLLSQKDCVGIRIYYANSKRLSTWQRLLLMLSNFIRKNIADAVGERHLILVGTDRRGVDQVSEGKYKPEVITDFKRAELNIRQAAAKNNEDEYELYEQSWPCPGTTGCPSNELTHS
jgi:hypothetical protein